MQRRTFPIEVFSALIAGWACFAASSVPACDLCCALCGTAEAESKVCRLVVGEKKITVTCWSCEAEDICLPGPSKPTCRHWDVACDDPSCHCCGDYRKFFVWAEWKPLGCCCKIVTKKKLMKKTVTKTVPSYKWVVEDLCPTCESKCETVTPPKGAAIPPAPRVEGAKFLGGMSPPKP